MADRYPGYDVLPKRDTQSWNDITRKVVDKRLAMSREPRFFSPDEWATLKAVCDRIMPQPTDRPPVPLAAFVDHKMADHDIDGYRYASLPPQGEAWRRGLAALDSEALSRNGARFVALGAPAQDDLLRSMQAGDLTSEAWGGMSSDMVFKHRVVPDITHAYDAHPVAWNEIGFGGPASPRGYVRMALDRRDPWEAAEAGAENDAAAARAQNRRVG